MIFKPKDTVRVTSDWVPNSIKGKHAQIIKLQTNYGEQYAEIKWKGTRATLLAEEYGILFPVKELKHVE